MKTILNLIAVAGLLVATSSFAQIAGSRHDFSGETWNPDGEICEVCHTPHNADLTVAEAPLWNHEVTEASFTPYASVTLTATDVAQPAASSKLCLSCHDGTVAVDNFGGTTTGTEFVTGNTLVGTNLSDDHPISFAYDTALASADGGLHDPATQTSGLGGTIDADLLLGGEVECASCHDVHNGAGLPFLLVKTNAASALCLTCHNK